MKTELKTKITAYRGSIVIEPIDPKKGVEDRWWPSDGGNKMGCVLGDCSGRLGISDEALELMRRIEVGHDAIGDIDCWPCTDGTWAFSWFGCLYRIIDSEGISARDFDRHVDKAVAAGVFVTIDNDVPAEAKDTIDNRPEHTAWKEPLSVPQACYETPEALAFAAAREAKRDPDRTGD